MAAKSGVSGVAIATMLHYKKFKIKEIKENLMNNSILARMV